MANKTVYLKTNGAETIAYEDQITEGVWHIPLKATEVEPPSFNIETESCKFLNDEWVVEDIPELEVRSAPEIITTYYSQRNHEYGAARKQIEFITENGLEAWQAKVAEIKAQFPKPD